MKKWMDKYFLYIPMVLVEIYLLFTVALYQFGPLNWKTENEAMFWTFLLLYHAAFILGYVLSIRKIKLRAPQWSVSRLSPRAFRGVMWAILAVCLVSACIEYKNLTHADSYIPYDLPRNFWNGLINPAKQYYSKGAAEGYTSNKLVTLGSALFSFIYVSLIPLLVVEWKRIALPQKILCFAVILFKVVVYVSVGTNKGIFDTMFGFVGILLILLLLNLYSGSDAHIDKKTFLKVSAFALFLVVFSFSYFTFNISTRVKSPVDYAMKVAGHQTETEPQETKPASKPQDEASGKDNPGEAQGEEAPEPTKPVTDPAQTPKPDSFLKKMYYSVTNYLTQGYYGMSLSLDEEFTTTYGIGNSQFLMSNFKSLFGIDVQDRTYQHKITDRWHESGKWHSFYSYFANDISFYGVVVLMFLIGLFYGCICKDVILNNSLLGKLLLPLFILMFMYMPANNQVFTAMATCTAFLELSFLWLLSKINWKKGSKHGK